MCHILTQPALCSRVTRRALAHKNAGQKVPLGAEDTGFRIITKVFQGSTLLGSLPLPCSALLGLSVAVGPRSLGPQANWIRRALGRTVAPQAQSPRWTCTPRTGLSLDHDRLALPHKSLVCVHEGIHFACARIDSRRELRLNRLGRPSLPRITVALAIRTELLGCKH